MSETRPRLTVTLRPARPAVAALWVRPGLPRAVAAELLGALGPAADEFELMAAGRQTLVRAVRGVAPWAGGFADSAVKGLFLPCGYRLTPAVPPGLAPPAGYLSWLTSDNGLTLHTAAVAFRPFTDWWTVSVPSRRPLPLDRLVTPFDPPIPTLPSTPRIDPPRVNRPPELPTRPAPRRKSLPKIVTALVPVAISRRRPEPSTLRLLEGRLVAESATLPPAGRAALWGELAAGYRAAGRPADVAVCRLNVAWCRTTHDSRWSAAEPEADQPVRAVWLTALARFDADGDDLALARCRDRLLARLAAGSEPDLDVPGFVRRTERRTDPDAARAWLTAIADPLRKWLTACASGTKLTAVGLGADRTATRCYAELIRAWGLATVGDRSAVGLATAAVAGLKALRRPNTVNLAVHRLLGERFLDRVRAALTGQPSERAEHSPDSLPPFDRYVVGRMQAACESLGASHTRPPLDTPTAVIVAEAEAARVAHRPDRFRDLLDTLDPDAATHAAGSLLRAAHALGFVGEAAALFADLRPPAGGRRDLGLAVGRFLAGDKIGGDRALDAARHRLFVAGVTDPRQRGELAVAYAMAVGHAAPALVFGRLDELFRRLGPVSCQGACSRYFALLPLRVVDAAVRAAVGDDFAPSEAVRRWLADEEQQTRRRIHADVRTLLK